MLVQQTITVSPSDGRYASPYGRQTWDTELTNPKLIAAVPVAPATARDVAVEGVHVRARLDGAVVTVDASGPAFTGPVDVLVTVEEAA